MQQIIAVLLVLTIVLLAVPIKVAFRIDRINEVKGQMIFYWLFGLVRFRIPIPDGVKTSQQHKIKPGEKAKKLKPRGKMRYVWPLLKRSAFRRHVVRFISGLLRAIHARKFYFRLRIGLGDPADTGHLWGIIGPLAGIAANLRRAEVRIEPEFTEPVLEVESHGEFRLIPLQFIGLVGAFALSPETMYAWRTLRRRKV